MILSVEVSGGSTACIPPQLPALLHNWFIMSCAGPWTARVAGNSATYGMATPYGVATPYGRSHTALDATVEMKLGTSSGDTTSANRPVRTRHSVDTRTILARQREGGALRCRIDRYMFLVSLYVLPFRG